MLTPDLALIFQPGVLSHPVHVMRPRDHVLSQQVLEFLIDNQDHFLIGMQLVSGGVAMLTPAQTLSCFVSRLHPGQQASLCPHGQGGRRPNAAVGFG